jgi:hypothetical protein
MASSAFRCLATIVALSALLCSAIADEPKGKIAPENKLVGTWRLLTAKHGGRDFKLPEGTTMVKHVTPTHFMWAMYGKDGMVTRSIGGAYTIKGETYEEMAEYGISSDFDLLKGNAQTFTWKVDENKWYHNGKLSNGLTIEQVWERLDK